MARAVHSHESSDEVHNHKLRPFSLFGCSHSASHHLVVVGVVTTNATTVQQSQNNQKDKMSSLRNAVKRVAHKERSQPQARTHLGILEKKKDYRQRAQDFHRKEDKIQAMQQKAAMRNPDEFYFGMNSAEIRDGRHRKTLQARQEETDKSIGPETVRIMKDQDLSYVRMQKQREARKVERLKASLHFIRGEEKKRKHTVFVDSSTDADNFDVAKHFDTVPELAGRAFNRPRVETLEAKIVLGTAAETELAQQAKHAKRTAKKIARAQASAYREMEARQKRVQAMATAEAHLETEKLVAAKGRKRKIQAAENGKPAVYKWRRKRAR
jgi:U3 small nucleolar RNA-associated protein 11